MRRLIWLPLAALALLLGISAGCSGAKTNQSTAGTQNGVPADNPTVRESDAADDATSHTTFNGGETDPDRAKQAGGRRTSTPAGGGTAPLETNKPSIDAVTTYLKSFLYPGSVFVSQKETMASGRTVIAMTSTADPAGTVKQYFLGKGAQLIDERTREDGSYTVTLEHVDEAKGIQVAIAIEQQSRSSNGCLVNYSASAGRGLYSGGGIPQLPGDGTQPGNPGQADPM